MSDVAIVGAGYVGVPLAQVFAEAGLSTVLVDVDHRMELMREESFGPVVGIQKVAGDDLALALMKDTSYGLSAGV